MTQTYIDGFTKVAEDNGLDPKVLMKLAGMPQIFHNAQKATQWALKGTKGKGPLVKELEKLLRTKPSLPTQEINAINGYRFEDLAGRVTRGRMRAGSYGAKAMTRGGLTVPYDQVGQHYKQRMLALNELMKAHPVWEENPSRDQMAQLLKKYNMLPAWYNQIGVQPLKVPAALKATPMPR